MKSEQLRFKFLESRRRIIFANQFCWNSIRAPFRHNILHCQNFWRPVEWPSIQRFCTFIPSAAFHLHHKTLFDAICFFNPKQRKRGVLSQLETWMSWRQPGTERRSFIFFPSHTLSFQHDIRCGRRLAVGYTCHAQGHDKRHTLNWITYLICLYKWFLFQLWCFFMGQQVESFNIFHKMQSWWPRSKTPPPSSANFRFLDNSSFSLCCKASIATYPVRNTNGSLCVISGFRREVHKICAVVGYYAAYSGNSLPTFRDNLSVPSSRVNKLKIWIFYSWRWDR